MEIVKDTGENVDTKQQNKKQKRKFIDAQTKNIWKLGKMSKVKLLLLSSFYVTTVKGTRPSTRTNSQAAVCK